MWQITPSAHYDKARNKMVRGIATYYDPTALVRRIQEAVNHVSVSDYGLTIRFKSTDQSDS